MPWEIWGIFRSKFWVKTYISGNYKICLSQLWISSTAVMIFSFASSSHHEWCTHNISHVNLLWILMIENNVRWNSWRFWFLLRILTETYPIFPGALGHIKISMIHQTKSTSMGINHAKGLKIRQPIPKLRGWLLFTRTFGHPVGFFEALWYIS